jgi:hypothetical protein
MNIRQEMDDVIIYVRIACGRALGILTYCDAQFVVHDSVSVYVKIGGSLFLHHIGLSLTSQHNCQLNISLFDFG